jgi:hypothetical protein
MFENKVVRYIVGVVCIVMLVGVIVTWWLPASAGSDVQIPAESLAQLKETPPDDSSPILTDLLDRLSAEHNVRQVLMLQAVPDQPPIVIATTEDSSDEEEATHWPSPWTAVNEALKSGRLESKTSVTGRHAGFDHRHTLVPMDATGSRILLINQMSAAPVWSFRRLLVTGVAVALLAVLFVSRR